MSPVMSAADTETVVVCHGLTGATAATSVKRTRCPFLGAGQAERHVFRRGGPRRESSPGTSRGVTRHAG